MFISALLKTGNNVSPSTGEHINKLWDTNIIEYYSAIKKGMICITRWMSLKHAELKKPDFLKDHCKFHLPKILKNAW